ncbi:FKBP-type peptidyl-prolyl cis-trans isomerase [Synoicihabitans lomoniglobus]|uniref:Peptidyl-prolyl cis-trans isomerase n=1 Tax=Synoicihabitans lomoniglobus TaxID=2909285 RepID=A0AAE9ZT63_9BACT|nr:FKBP-type peptidyl-prolyl cis-trans isomerase [Opitutaceae bacterium LMO-M01]WED63811.1 FKBP-type peptidyl-prolyl cis-trans isomerase [Opitutaceae bacterium LMO-M01]
MRALRPLLIPALFGLILLGIALVTRSGKLARENPGVPINSAMREAMHMMVLPPADEALVNQRYPQTEITSSGLRYIVTAPGDGVTHPQRGEKVAVHYRGNFLDGTYLDDSYKRNGPYIFPAGVASVIPGWDEAVMDMSKGEKRTLIIPYWLAYGEKGVKGHIPEKTTLIFEIELVDVF